MKQVKNQVAILAALLMVGCAAIETGHDPVVVNAERVTAVATDSFDSFVKYEKNNRATLWELNRGIKGYADHVRTDGQKWLRSARAMTQAYKHNRNEENKANLQTAMAVLQEAINQINQYMSVGNRP